jgi:hypothetical protein
VTGLSAAISTLSDEGLIDTIVATVEAVVRDRAAGHCIQVPHLPAKVAEQVAKRLWERLPVPDLVRLVRTSPTQPWHASPTKVVELRNSLDESPGRLVVFVEAGQLLAAEDSFGSSTFEIVEVSDAHSSLVARLVRGLEEDAPDIASRVISVVENAANLGVPSRRQVDYLQRIVADPISETIGAALDALGLMPDRLLGDVEEDRIPRRIRQNHRTMEALTEPEPPAERVRRITEQLGDEASTVEGALINAVGDGVLDRHEIARRLARLGVDLEVWRPKEETLSLTELEILALVGDISAEAEPSLTKARAHIGIRYRMSPAAAELDELQELTLELLRVGDTEDDLLDTGVTARKRRKQLPKTSSSVWKVRVESADLEPGFYRFRLAARDTTGMLLKEARSAILRVETDLPGPEPIVRVTGSLAGARLVAKGLAFDGELRGERVVVVREDSSTRLAVQIRWENVADSFELQFSKVLAEVERLTLEDPGSLGRYSTSFGASAPEDGFVPPANVPRDFLIARERTFDAIRRARYPVEGGRVPPLIGLADLSAVAVTIEAYAESWMEALRGTDDVGLLGALLSVDQLVVRDPGRGELRLAGPTHPLRLLWRLRHSASFADAVRRNANKVRDLSAAIDSVLPQHVPMVVAGDHGLLRSVASFGLDWTVYLRPSASDVPATLSRLAGWLGFDAPGILVAAPREITHRILRYLSAHPWVETVVANFIQPGAADVVLQALLDLQGDPLASARRYAVRLFSSDLHHDELGRVIDDFMASPDGSRRWRNDAADALLAASTDPLVPHFTYSKHRLEDLTFDPSAFPAHLTFLLDWFELDLEAVDPLPDGRSIFGAGLIVEPTPTYRLDGSVPMWRMRVVTSAEGADLFERAYAAAHGAAAVLVGGRAEQDIAIRLELDRVKQSVIDAVHRASEWVVTIDPVFGDEFLDAPGGDADSPRYVVESGDALSVRHERHVLVSTKSRSELKSLLGPALARHGLNIADERLERVLDALQAVGAGASLRLLTDRNHADEALSMALASLWLQNNGTLRRSIVMPLDLHQDLFRAVSNDSEWGQSRSDLAVVRIEPESRSIAFHLVELKVRSGGEIGIPPELISQIRKQLANSRKALREAMFDADDRSEQGSLVAVMRLRYVVTTLRRYLNRAVRYRLIDGEYAGQCRKFIDDLDGRFTLSFSELGLVFDLEHAGGSTFEQEGVEFTKVGRDVVEALLLHPDQRMATLPPSLDFADLMKTIPGGRSGLTDSDIPEPLPTIELAATTDAPDLQRANSPAEVEPSSVGAADGFVPDHVSGPDPDSVLMIGMAPTRRQFGIIGRVPGALPVAIDMDGTNVISIFGVQGSGKSYTLGTIIEAALVQGTPLNRLPNPLGAVVFHYSTDNTYVPEFASMAHANSDQSDADVLSAAYVAAPISLDDVRVLVPPDLVDERAADFPGLDVRPLYLGANELRLDDWKLLMGIEGGDQMYSKAMNGIFRQLRDHVSVDALELAIDNSGLSISQKRIAQTRLSFARPYISNTEGASEHLIPGRLLVIDLRDELIESDEALALFMILLGRFAQAEWHGSRFNKLIVFDEAHKYMDQPKLTNKIVETVREMRHKGTSVVIASQNPPSVPREVIELSSIVFVHRFTAPTWLDHIRRANADFADARILPSHLTKLGPGEAYVWSTGSREFRHPQLVRVRPRLTRHGGGTIRATD